MKIFTNDLDKKIISGLKIQFLFFYLLISKAHSQVLNDQSVYVGDFGEAYIATGQFIFGLNSTLTQTSRTPNYGVISFSSLSSWSGADNSHFLDGYGRYYGTNSFILPLGDSNIYAPVSITPNSSLGVDAAYYRTNPNTIGTVVDAAVSSISNLEFWHVKGQSPSTMLTLSWRSSSDVVSLTNGDLDNLVILGYNGSVWVEIPSTVDVASIYGSTSTLIEGSITSNSPINLSFFEFFTFGSKASVCAPLISSSGIIKTWNGVWSPSQPTLADPVVINAPYSGSLSCNSLVLNNNISLNDGEVVEIVNGVTGTGKIIMSNESSVVQRNPSVNGPNIEMTKITNPMRRFDYVFLSSPITSSTTFFSHILNKDNVAANGSFGSQPASAFQQLRTYDAAGLSAINATAANTPIGRGFSATVRSQAPYSTSTVQGSWYTQKFPIHIKTLGIANNGNIPVTVPSNGWARIGNPYPSAISAEKLLDATGSNVRKTIYYWTYNSPRGTIPDNSSYNNADFATWNYSGGVAACPTCEIPTGIIATMQSVLVKASNANSTTFDLTNCMRETTGNDNFFKNSTQDKFRLNLTGSSGSFSQILIAYNEFATNNEDQGYDGLRIGGSSSSVLSSLIDQSKYAIQTRSSFSDQDIVPLQVDKNIEEQLTVSLATKEGVFEQEGVIIYLHDKELGIYHNLEQGEYSFIQSTTNDSSRFEIVYLYPLLETIDFDLIKTLAFIKSDTIYFQSTKSIKDIDVYDIAGRKIVSFNNINSNFYSDKFFHAEGVYIAKIVCQDGSQTSQKLINNN